MTTKDNYISSKSQLRFYIAADRIMNGLPARISFRDRVFLLLGLTSLTGGGKPREYLRLMRYSNYYSNQKGMVNRIIGKIVDYKYHKLGLELGFSISPKSFGYGLVIPHHGTIVVNGGCTFGNYCVLHTSTCVAGGEKTFGDGLYLSAGAKITGKGDFGDAISIAANSVVNRPASSHCLLAGMPAEIKKTEYPFWYERDGERFLQRVLKVEELKKQMNIRMEFPKFMEY